MYNVIRMKWSTDGNFQVSIFVGFNLRNLGLGVIV